jgi:hypothetical protein
LWACRAIIRENQPIVTNEHQLSLRNNPLKVKTSGKLPITLQDVYGINLKSVKKNGKISKVVRVVN